MSFQVPRPSLPLCPIGPCLQSLCVCSPASASLVPPGGAVLVMPLPVVFPLTFPDGGAVLLLGTVTTTGVSHH